MYNETTRLVRVIEVPLVADDELVLEAPDNGNAQAIDDNDGGKSAPNGETKGATKEPVRGESDDQQTGVTYKLSDTAENLWIAYEVVAEFTDDTGRTHYAQLAKKEMASKNSRSADAPKVFRFTFDSGDEFECENADDYPTLANGGEDGLAMTGTVPYGTGGGGTGGGVLVVTATVSGSTMTLDKTWQEIHDADAAIIHMDTDENNRSVGYFVNAYSMVPRGYGIEFVAFNQTESGWVVDGIKLTADSASDYPSATMG